MYPPPTLRFPLAFFLAGAVLPARAFAFEPGSLGDEPVSLEITEVSSVLYNADNRNERPGAVERRTDDDWGLWYNRLNLQASWKKWRAGLRIDSAWFYTSPSPAGVGLELLQEERGNLDPPFTSEEADYFVTKTFQAGEELSNRYIDWIYPAKYWVGYATPDVEVTVGDVYAQLGRGLVLSVRKLDELSSDTTIRGARLTGRLDAGPLKLKLTGVGGTMNPLRIDEASGRYLGVDRSELDGFSRVTEAGMPAVNETAFVADPRPSFSTDRLAGLMLEGGPKAVKLGVQGSLLSRQFPASRLDPALDAPLSGDLVRTADEVRTGSVSVNVPDLDDHGTAYLEVAGQHIRHPRTLEGLGERGPDNDLDGRAVYGSVTLLHRPVTVTVEAKDYHRFYPLTANVDLQQAPELSVVQYSAPPTTEAFWVDTEFEGFNTCVQGGRAKSDFEVGSDESVFFWVGHYRTWAESIANETCNRADENLNRVWDVATGLEITSQRKRSRASTVIGARVDDTDREIVNPQGELTNVFYRESYARYDVIRWLHDDWSLQLQGWHRRRLQTLGGPDDRFWQGQHLTGVTWKRVTGALGVEYDTDPGTPDLYFNGQIKYDIDSASNLSLFVGQRRGGLRCVAGVCRVFPPFEGARLDATLRF